MSHKSGEAIYRELFRLCKHFSVPCHQSRLISQVRESFQLRSWQYNQFKSKKSKAEVEVMVQKWKSEAEDIKKFLVMLNNLPDDSRDALLIPTVARQVCKDRFPDVDWDAEELVGQNKPATSEIRQTVEGAENEEIETRQSSSNADKYGWGNSN